ncbi:alpha-L-arabinofuranosidase C-terminal domain-containing protein [Kribbella shirazensis]|uniref:Alpha-L-arabinofuranosidase n=1 Tax=Kribbella shirazensis TaxID=1105143 RepID=A0A7X6A4Y5_9ACTN|nr:alpha-L-arabinofuranosidase [Kribbella shirazensis]
MAPFWTSPSTGRIAVFLQNRSTDGPVELTLDLRSTAVSDVLTAVSLYDDDRFATNTANQPNRVEPRPNTTVRVDQGRVTLTLPPISWTAVQLAVS